MYKYLKVFVSLLFFLFDYSFLSGQIRVEGHITSQENGSVKALPFANIVLRNTNDSTKIEFATATDMQGYYVFESVPMKKYDMEVSFLGYKTIHKEVEVTYPEVGGSLEFDYSLAIDNQTLNEVTVTANPIQKGIDKTVYRISSSDMKLARSSMDLLEKIPSLSIDPVTQRIVLAKGSLKILIDGVSSSEIDLKSIPPDKVVRMDYYNIPPALYMEYSAVVNVITKNLDDGFSAGASLQHAFTTGFANDDLFLKFNRGRQQFSADYTLNYRNYTDVHTIEKYNYLMNDESVSRVENSTNPFGYNDHFINLKYVNQLQDNYIFQVKFSPNINFRRFIDKSTIEIMTGEVPDDRTGNKIDKSNTFNPSLDIYFWKQLKNKQAITVDVLGNLFTSHQTILNQELSTTNDQVELDDSMNMKNFKKSLIGEVAYEKGIRETDKLSFGNKVETYTINSDVTNSFDNGNYISSYFSDYLYGDYTGQTDKFMYRATIGMMYRHNNNSITRYSSWIFRPLLMLGYTFDSKNSVRLIFTQATDEPDISEQSSNVVFVTDNILKEGNPYLKNSLTQTYLLNYGFTNKRLDLDLFLVGVTAKNNIGSYYIKSDNYYLLTSSNDNKNVQFGLAYSGSIKPFGTNLLTFKLNGEVSRNSVTNSAIGYFTHWYAPFKYEVSMEKGKFVISYQGTLVSNDLSGTYLRRDENNSNFIIRYTQKKFSIWGGLLFAFAPSRYVTETIPGSVVSYSSNRKIYDNRNMFTLGFSYTFNSGKKYSEQDKKINNKDTDSGLFK